MSANSWKYILKPITPLQLSPWSIPCLSWYLLYNNYFNLSSRFHFWTLSTTVTVLAYNCKSNHGISQFSLTFFTGLFALRIKSKVITIGLYYLILAVPSNSCLTFPTLTLCPGITLAFWCSLIMPNTSYTRALNLPRGLSTWNPLAHILMMFIPVSSVTMTESSFSKNTLPWSHSIPLLTSSFLTVFWFICLLYIFY